MISELLEVYIRWGHLNRESSSLSDPKRDRVAPENPRRVSQRMPFHLGNCICNAPRPASDSARGYLSSLAIPDGPIGDQNRHCSLQKRSGQRALVDAGSVHETGARSRLESQLFPEGQRILPQYARKPGGDGLSIS